MTPSNTYDADSPIQFVQVGIHGPNLPKWYFAKISGLGKYLRSLPSEVRESVGYTKDPAPTASSEEIDEGQVYIELSIGFYGFSVHKKFPTVQALLAYIDTMPKVGRALEYKKKL